MRHLPLIALILFVFTSSAFAQFTLPHINGAQEANEFKQMIAEQAPWYKNYGGEPHVTAMAGVIPALTPWLEANKDWQEMAAARPARRTITVSEMKEGYENGRTVRPAVFEQWVKDIQEVLFKVGNEATVFQLAGAELEWVVTHDARALITGLINSVPGIDKGKMFKLGSGGEVLEALEKEAGFTDENLKKNFRAQAFGLEESQVTRANLAAMVKESLDREAALPKFIRAAWAQHTLKAAELKNLGKVQPLELDVFGTAPEKLKAVYEKMGVSAKGAAFLQKQIKTYMNDEDYVIDRIKVMVPGDFVTIEEVSPAIGATRGCFMYDCSLGAWGHAFAATEYVFAVRDSKGNMQGFMAATRAKTQDGDVLFVHDFGAQGLKKKTCDFAIRGLYLAKEDMGFVDITFAANNGNNGEWAAWVQEHAPKAKLIKQEYYDTAIRAHIERAIGYPHGYDLGTNANNHNGKLYVPEGIENYGIQVELTADGPAMPDQLSNSELLLKAIGILTLNPDAGLSSEMRAIGMHPGELNALLKVLRNDEHMTLAEYYDSLKEFLAKYEINMSRNFIRDHEYLFQPGHLNASDAVTTDDKVLKNQTVRYVVYAFKHDEKLAPLFEIVQANLEYFKANENFDRYIKSFSGHGAREPETLERLMLMGFNFDYVLKDKEAKAIFLAGKSPLVRMWVLESMKPAELAKLPVEIVRLIAEDLGEDHDEIPNRASKILLHTNNDDEKVMKELKRSGKDEEVIEIAMRTGVLFFEAGGESDSLAKRIRKYEGKEPWDAELRKRLDALLPKLPEPKKEKSENQEDCEDKAAGVRRRAG